ncbi:MAG: S8 family serine peptidase [Candidatus Polarisedimenticolia bacterium]
MSMRGWFETLKKGAGIATAFFLMCALAGPAAAQATRGQDKLSPELAERVGRAGGDDLVPVIVQTKEGPSTGHYTRLHGRGGYVKFRNASVPGYSGRVPASQLAALAEDPEVLRVSLDNEVKAHMDVAARAVGVNLLSQTFGSLAGSLDGRGVGVAVIDTGSWNHEDLKAPSSRLVRVEVSSSTNTVNDQYGHGTHVAGIIGGSGSMSGDLLSYRNFAGLAPGATLVAIRALDAEGNGYTSDIMAAVDWAIANRAQYNIRVINMSLGHPVYESYATDPLCRAARAAHDAGILVVVSAGNDGAVGSGFGTITSPGNEPTAVTVGAMDDRNTADRSDDVLAWYSSRGPSLVDHVVKPDLVAPGSRIVSLRATGSYLDTNYHAFTLKLSEYRLANGSLNQDGYYYELSGTSMAAPMVAGTAALMFQKEPGLNPDTVKARLMASAIKDTKLIFETGAGYLDIPGALSAGGYTGYAPSPTAVLGQDGEIYIVSADGLVWGGSWDLGLIWNTLGLVWGGSWDLSIIWGIGKGLDYGFVLTELDEAVVGADGFIWNKPGGKGAGTKSVVDNTEVTADSIIWGIFGWFGGFLNSTSGTIETQGAVWKKNGR